MACCCSEAVSFDLKDALINSVTPAKAISSFILNWYAGLVRSDSSFMKNSSARCVRKSYKVGLSCLVFSPFMSTGSNASSFVVFKIFSLLNEAWYNFDTVVYNLSMLQVLMSLLFSTFSFVLLSNFQRLFCRYRKNISACILCKIFFAGDFAFSINVSTKKIFFSSLSSSIMLRYLTWYMQLFICWASLLSFKAML